MILLMGLRLNILITIISSGPQIKYYGDASGSKHTSFAKLGRVGCAAVQVNPDSAIFCWSKFQATGSVQTAGRGELFALQSLTDQLLTKSICIFIADNRKVYDTFHKGPAAGANSNNCDMWKDIFANSCHKAPSTSVRRCPSQSKEEGEVLPEGVSWLEVEADDLVDKYVGEAVQRKELPNPVTWRPKLTVSIHRRLARSLINPPVREFEKKI